MMHTIEPKSEERTIIRITSELIKLHRKYPDRRIHVTIEIEGLDL